MAEDPDRLELKHARIGVGSHSLLGIIVGYFSIMVTAIIGTILAIFVGFVIVIGLGYVVEKVIGKKGFKWWFGNGIIVYLLIWLVAWTFFLNLV